MLIHPSNVYAKSSLYDAGKDTYAEKLTSYDITTGTDKDRKSFNRYLIEVSAKEGTTVFPIEFSQKGLLFYNFEYSDENPQFTYPSVEVYSDEACSKIVSNSYSKIAAITRAGTYYVKFSVSNFSTNDFEEDDTFKFSFASQFVGGGDRTLKDKTWSAVGLSSYDDQTYFQIKVPKAGTLTIETDSGGTGKIVLLNSKQNAISDPISYLDKSNKSCFAVEKGTYYILYKGNYNKSVVYRIKSTFKPITELGGDTKAKAKLLKKGKLYSGLAKATGKTNGTDWYKFTLTKTQKVNIIFKGNVASGRINLELTSNNISRPIKQSLAKMSDNKSFSVKSGTSTLLRKGTYYIKITKDTKNTSGIYYLGLGK